MRTRFESGGLSTLVGLVIVSAACGGAPADQSKAEHRPRPDSADGAVAITHVTIVDVADGRHATGMTVLIKDREIAEIGREVAVPPGATRLDGTGKYLIPGLAEAVRRYHSQVDEILMPLTPRAAEVRALREKHPLAHNR